MRISGCLYRTYLAETSGDVLATLAKITGCLVCQSEYFLSNPGCGSQSVCTDDDVPPFMETCADDCSSDCQEELSMAALCSSAADGNCINANIKDDQGNFVEEVLEEDFTCKYI